MTARAIIRLAVGLSIAVVIGGPAWWRAQGADAGLGRGVAASRIVRVMSHAGDAGITECLGFLYSPDWVLTAAHCVRGGSLVEVVTLSAVRSDVTQVENHPAMDVSALRVRAFARFDAAAIAPPRAHERTAVIVSGLERRESTVELRQRRGVPYHWTPEAVRVRSDARPCRGDSGGPLLTAEGAIVGVLSRGSISCDGRDEYVVLAPLAAWLRRITTRPGAAFSSSRAP